MQSRTKAISLLILISLAVAFVAGCGSGMVTTANTNQLMGTVNSTVSDPPTCSRGTGGTYQHVYVTIVDVKVHQSSTAGATDSGWIDLSPSLASAPKQVDLLGTASTQCFLAQLGAQQIQAGAYQQIRLLLLANNNASQLSTNACGPSAANCVVLANGSVKTLQLSSEAQTGIKIPSGQIAGGGFTVPAGSTVDLNIDFDACASIVVTGNGQYRLKPVLHAGEVSLNDTSISGTVVDSVTLQPIAGKSIVALEQKDAAGVDRVIMQTLTDALGNFTFCPVPTGTYDVVAVGISTAGVAYAATVTSGVQPGNAVGNVPLIAETGANTTQGSITGQLTTAAASAGTAADITLSALQSVTINGTATPVTIPLAQQLSSTASVTTASDPSCPVGTFCVSYTLGVPAANASVGAFSSGGTTYTAGAAAPFNYSVDAQAFVPSSGGTADCTTSDMQAGPVSVTAGGSVAATTIAFTGCQ